MNKKLERLLRPNMGGYYVLLLGFVLATALLQHYVLAGIELAAWALIMAGYLLHRANRRKQLKAFVEKTVEEQSGLAGQRPPFPMVAVRLADGGVVYANDRFATITGFNDVMKERNIADFLPGFDTEWLISGKTEYPYDVKLGAQRYRIYGAALQNEDTAETRDRKSVV